jgi:hypothetical protein
MGWGFTQSYASKAQEFGLEGHSWPLRDLVATHRMLAHDGVAETLFHARAILLMRAIHELFDRRLQQRMPQAAPRPTLLHGMELRTVSDTERRQAELCSPISAMTFRLALRALSLDARTYHFMDVGSGWGYASLLAAMQPFRHVSGVEFARELHEAAIANIAWARAERLLRCEQVDLRHESALETELPEGPLLLFLYHPFGADVLAQFLDRVDASIRSKPRPIIALYAGPLDATPFTRPGVVEVPLKGAAALGLRLFSPRAVRAWRWTS